MKYQGSILLWLIILLMPSLKAQESLLFSNDRFSGISEVESSPTQSFFNENNWDIHLFSEGVSLYNDYLYISQQSILGLPFTQLKTASIKKGIRGTTLPNVIDYYNKDFGNLYLDSKLQAPSFDFSTTIRGHKYIFGLFSVLRTQTSILDVDNYLRFQNSGEETPLEYSLKPLKAQVLNRAEIGFHFARNFWEDDQKEWIFGLNLKYEAGLDAVYLNSQNTSQLSKILQSDGSTYHTRLSDYDINVFYATSYDFTKQRYTGKIQGRGLGLDLGLTYVQKDLQSDQYNWKIGFNILDLGYINFKGAQHHLAGTPFEFESFKNIKIKNPEQFFGLVSKEIYGDASKSFVGNTLRLVLPTNIRINYSKKIKENHFLTIDWIQRVPLSENAVRYGNRIQASYSVQKNGLGYGGAINLFEYQNLQFGGYLRLGPVIIGSDNILPVFIKQKQLHSSSIYVAFKLSPFWDTDLKRRQRSKCGCD